MNLRTYVAGLFMLALVAGCASGSAGGGGSAGGLTAQQFDEENLPEWVLALPEGTPPRDIEQTNEAEVALFQARSTRDEARASTFFREALTLAQAGIAADPGNPQPHFQAGQAHLGLGDLQAAGASFDRAETIYPRYILDTQFLREEAWIEEYNLGIDVLGTDPATALTHLERAHAIYKGRPEAMLQLGQLYVDRERYAEAIDVFTVASETIQSPRAREGADAELLAQWEDALEVVRFNQAQLLFVEGRYLESAEVYEDILEASPDDLGAMTNLGVALISAGETERANQVFARLRDRPDLSAREFFLIGVGLQEANQLQEAAQVFAEAHERIPQDREALFQQAQALYFWANDQGGEWAQVVPVTQDLIVIDTHTELSHQFHYNALLLAGRGEEAQAAFDALQALPFVLAGVRMEAVQGGAAVVGQVTNRSGAAGTNVRLRMHFYGPTGAPTGTADTTVSLPAAGEAVFFQADLSTSAEVMGYRYEVLN